MDFRKYAQGINFNVNPDRPVHLLEVYNTELPGTWKRLDLIDLCAMPRMSTFAIACIINKAVREMPADQCFVNVGVWHGFTFLAGMLGNPDKRCIGVDNFSEFGGPRSEFRQRFMDAKSDAHTFFDMGYKQYFAGYHKQQAIGFYIYDGAHDYASQLDGLKIAEPYLAEGALILVDDTNWPDPDKATRDFMAASEFNYDIILDKKTSGNGHPTWWNGILVIQKHGRKLDHGKKV